LAFTRPPHHWKAHFITVAGGPLVNVIICLVAGAALGMLTGIWWRVAIPNPIDPFAGLWEISYSWPLIALYLINALSLLLLLFNLLPIFPLDGGRLVQSLLWPRYGYTRSMRFAVRAGYVGAIVLFIYGAVTDTMMLVFIALFGAFTCYMTHKQLQWTDETMGFESDEYALSLHAGAEEHAAPEPALSRRAQKQLERDQQEAQEVDRILQKIADSGMESLTRGERALLKRYTERKRQQ
jgi:hypothetical protein